MLGDVHIGIILLVISISLISTTFAETTLYPIEIASPDSNAGTFGINVELDENLYVIHAGVFDITPNPSMAEVAFRANGIDLPVQNIEQMFAGENTFAWWSKPFVVAPENNLTARIYGNVIQTELAGFLGYTVARRNVLIRES